ncbi:nuclear transport factor 2 family protein [Chitinophaga sp. S165]|uniref:nuclear transport factor 2 family protein n=1 Tax=Chitinophaga sp. S165 TaxID=2135462 RepID=UPI000DA10535|nr:nuclear transport factor 2 family protein [Chitinophaga sp. S165]PWV47715.1 putative SnoaL-like aldol condensation-catalyzing enzyme [Chitinophaga sp. S165]
MSIRSNKEIVLEIYRRMIGGRDLSLIDTYISDRYIQHSAMLRDGKAGLQEALEQLKQLPPSEGQVAPVVCAIAEGDFVALLLNITLMEKAILVIDLFRLEQGLIVEHWDAMREKDLVTASTDVSGLKVRRILKEDSWTLLQSEGTAHNSPHVCYDIFRSDGSVVQEQIRIIQVIPKVLPHGNGMI